MSESATTPTAENERVTPPPGIPSAAPRAASGFSILKACAWSGPIYLVGMLIMFAVVAGYVPPPREHWAVEEVASYYRDNETRIKLGMEGMILFACFYYFWSLAIARVMERTEGRDSLLARIQVFGAFSTAWVTTAVGLAFVITAFRAGERNPEDLRLFNDVGWLIFMLTPTFVFFQLIAIGIAWLKPERDQAVVPRWLGYMTLWVCATFLITFVVPFIQRGPFAWHGLITFYIPFGLFCVWMMIACVYVIRAINKGPEIGRPT